MSPPLTIEEEARAKVKSALRLVCASMPHLAGLASAVRIHVDRRVPTAAVSQAGRLVVNPEWFASLDYGEATFIAGHELLHLCLQTHERELGTDHELFNWAHDYIINDIMVHELGRPVPRGGLVYEGARDLSAEKVATMLKRGQLPGPKPVPRSNISRALEEAGLVPQQAPDLGPGSGDVLSREAERRLFPDADSPAEEQARTRVRQAAAKSLSLGRLKSRIDAIPTVPGESTPAQGTTVAETEALRSCYRPPWELALQQWMEAVAPGPRSYARPSRRGSDRLDVVLPGRTRVGWALHIVLDTSGSMVEEIPRLLGLIASFCEAVGVGAVHLLQCDVQVTQDEWIEPEQLFHYTVSGFGGSDLSPALLQLSLDPEVEAVLVLTDGYIDYPAQPMPYELLWVLTEPPPDFFTPGYGHAIQLPPRNEG